MPLLLDEKADWGRLDKGWMGMIVPGIVFFDEAECDYLTDYLMSESFHQIHSSVLHQDNMQRYSILMNGNPRSTYFSLFWYAVFVLSFCKKCVFWKPSRWNILRASFDECCFSGWKKRETWRKSWYQLWPSEVFSPHSSLHFKECSMENACSTFQYVFYSFDCYCVMPLCYHIIRWREHDANIVLSKFKYRWDSAKFL